MKRPATGVALAWMLLISATPFVGAAAYLLIGERRIGRRRGQGIKTMRVDIREIADAAIRKRLTDVDWSRHSPDVQCMDKIGRRLIGFPTVSGSNFELMSDTQEILKAIVNDIDSAKTSVLMEFYIWNAGGTADEVLEAVIRAAKRGVVCCLLIDALAHDPGGGPSNRNDCEKPVFSFVLRCRSAFFEPSLGWRWQLEKEPPWQPKTGPGGWRGGDLGVPVL